MLQNAAQQENFNVFSWINWISIISMFLTTVNIIVISFLFIRYKSLSLIVFTLTKARGNQFDFIISTSTTTPTTDTIIILWEDIQEALKDLWSLELILLLIFLLILSVTIAYFIGKCKQHPDHSTIIELQLLNTNEDMCFTRLKLKYPAHFYRIDLSPIAISINRFCFFSRLHFNDALAVRLERTKTQLKIPKSIFVYPHLSRKAWRLINSDSCIACIVILKVEYNIVDLLPLSWHGQPISLSARSMNLYPTEELSNISHC